MTAPLCSCLLLDYPYLYKRSQKLANIDFGDASGYLDGPLVSYSGYDPEGTCNIKTQKYLP